MANQEHLEILMQGVGDWNKWREENDELLSKNKIRINRSEAAKNSIEVLRGVKPWSKFLEGVFPLDLSGADLSNIDLSNANFSTTNLNGGNLNSTILNNADFRFACLCGTNFGNADLAEANFSTSFLIATDFSGADLGFVNFNRAFFSFANVSNAILFSTIFGDIDLRSTNGLETVAHAGPSVVGIDTLIQSHGSIPESFLRGTGCPDFIIDYARSLIEQPDNYYSCFISFSSKDEVFAKKLYADLQNSGVRCWFAPKDLKIGDKFRTRIDESIYSHDKLLLVLSQNSVKSTWVEKEVETAFEKERKQKKTVLFPISLDESVKKTRQVWARDIQCTRHIGNFADWKNDDEYQVVFQQLLHNLKAEE